MNEDILIVMYLYQSAIEQICSVFLLTEAMGWQTLTMAPLSEWFLNVSVVTSTRMAGPWPQGGAEPTGRGRSASHRQEEEAEGAWGGVQGGEGEWWIKS